MNVKIIKTDEDHAAAIQRLAKLMSQGPAPGTPLAHELELLAHLIEDYEKKRYDIGLPDPLTAIRFRMEQQGLKRKDLIPFLGSASRVSEVLGGKRQVSVQMIRKLHEGLGIPLEVLMQDPAPGEDGKAEDLPKPSLKALEDMFARGWFAKFRGTLKQAGSRVDELLTGFFAKGAQLAATPAFNRQMRRHGAAEDEGALLAWRMRVLQRAAKSKVQAEFDPEAISPAFLRQLAGLSRLGNGPVSAIELLESHGITVVVERHLPGTFLDGAALLLSGQRPVIGLTLRHDRLDNFWFCLFHELGHVLKHLATGKANESLDDLDEPAKDQCEREADEFAFYSLVPKKDWELFLARGDFDTVTVRREAKRLLIDAAILAGRIRHSQKDFKMLTSLVGHGRVRALFEAA